MKSITILFVLLSLPYASLAALSTKAKQAYLVDSETGVVLFEKNAQEKMVPSSMTKLMTTYIVFERLQKNILNIDDKFRVSKKAWKKGGSKMFLRHTERVSVDALLNGIIVQSGNDACITIAEGLSSSEENFANVMNETAADLGMKNSYFKNATGWPDEGHYMSAEDIGILSNKLIANFPEYYDYFSKEDYTYSGIKQNNRNALLGRYEGLDGLKTGHTDDGGYGISVSAKRGDTRLVAVVNGLSSDSERADEAEKLLNYGFRYFVKETLYDKGAFVTEADVWMGDSETVVLEAAEGVNVLLPKLKKEKTIVEINYNSPIIAPIKKGDKIATMIVKSPDMKDREFALMSGKDIQKLTGIAKMIRNIKKYF